MFSCSFGEDAPSLLQSGFGPLAPALMFGRLGRLQGLFWVTMALGFGVQGLDGVCLTRACRILAVITSSRLALRIRIPRKFGCNLACL